MALIGCPECNKEVSEKAIICPNCGAKIGNGHSRKANRIFVIGLLFFAVCCLVLIFIISSLDNAKASEPGVYNESNKDSNVINDFSDVNTTYELTAGYYTAGIDIPSGRCDVIAISGTGNLMSSNMYNGGVNEVFGIDDGTGIFTGEFNGLKLPEGTVLSTNGLLVIKLEYSDIEGGASGRKYDDDNAIELNSGNYIAGIDFPQGVYTIEAISGNGNLISTNLYSGGVNEVFGIDDGYGFYNSKVSNVVMEDNVELSVSGGLSVRLIPCN